MTPLNSSRFPHATRLACRIARCPSRLIAALLIASVTLGICCINDRGQPGVATSSMPKSQWIATGAMAVAAIHHASSTARVGFTRTHSGVLAASAILASLEFVHSLEELHDLDTDQVHEEDTWEAAGGGGKPLVKQPQDRVNEPDIFSRFSRAIAAEIMRRVPSVKSFFQLRPWQKKGRQHRSQEGGAPPTFEAKTQVQPRAVDVNNERRVGAWCPPESLEVSDSNPVEASDISADESIADKSVVACPPDSSKSIEGPGSCSSEVEGGESGLRADGVEPGLVVYVFPQGKVAAGQHDHALAAVHPKVQSIDLDDVGESDAESGESSTIYGTRCLQEMGRHYDEDEQVVQYTLLRREPVELGNVDVHREDFAYQPVVLTIDGGTGGSYGSELAARMRPKEDEVMESFISSPGQSSWRGANMDGDRQVSFRWWSWFSHFLNYRSNEDEQGLVHPGSVLPDAPEQSHYQSNLYEEHGKRPFAGGSHGEIWRARRRCPVNVRRSEEAMDQTAHNATTLCDDEKDLIVKRLKIEYGIFVLEAGLREVYFGELLGREVESSSLFTTYVDHFFREGRDGQVELWIVFENAGPSLRSYLYTPVESGGFVVYQHSAFWRRLRRSIAGGRMCKGCEDDESLVVATPVTNSASAKNQHRHHRRREANAKKQESEAPEGRTLLREVLRQLITSVAFLHERGIVHRDIKPSNVMCKTVPPTEVDNVPHDIESVRCLLGDFSSAWDEFSARNLYANGPSRKEQTDEYAPPEVLLQGRQWAPFFHDNPFSYDSWSIGVVALELLLGTPNVFSVDQRTKALLTNRLRKEGASERDIQRGLYLAALSQFCIYVPTESQSWPLREGDPLHREQIVKNKCTLQDFHNALRARDPLGIGFDDDANKLLHLIFRLLDWNPLERLSASDALEHPYFERSQRNGYWNPTFLHAKLFPETTATATVSVDGNHNALEHQTLDPRVDMSTETSISEFICPKCGKTFTDHNSCQTHARSRRHAHFCTYNRSLLPHCLSAHSMLPTHPTFGYCDIQGRRKTIEDFFTVHLREDHEFYGVFDGHLGNLASKYAASSFHREVEECLSGMDPSQPEWRDDVASKLEQSFGDLHNGILDAVQSSPGEVMSESGTTATVLYVTDLAVILANVGDSRAIMTKWETDAKGNVLLNPTQLTIDHVASEKDEQAQVVSRGGYISESGGIDRVNGSLAVSRSLGDIKLAPFLSQTPHVVALTKTEALEQCGKASSNGGHMLPCFVILASDGLWDVVTNEEAVDLAWQVIQGNGGDTAFQEAAEVLTQEAYVRGSSDNIGVCVVSVDGDSICQ